MELLFIIGRIIFGAIFIFSGISHFTKMKDMKSLIASKKMPMPEMVSGVTGLMLLFGGLTILIWQFVVPGIVVLLVFLIPVTLVMHAFWSETQAENKMTQMHYFMGNMSLVGLLLVLLSMILA
jgi:putative oxidoreductase